VRETEFIVVSRPVTLFDSAGARVHRLETVALPVSSSETRQALGARETPEELPPAVAEYIRITGYTAASARPLESLVLHPYIGPAQPIPGANPTLTHGLNCQQIIRSRTRVLSGDNYRAGRRSGRGAPPARGVYPPGGAGDPFARRSRFSFLALNGLNEVPKFPVYRAGRLLRAAFCRFNTQN